MVIRPCSVCIACDQFAAADVTGNAKGIFFSYHLAVRIEDELHQAAIFFHLMPQALGVVAVDLDVAIKGLHLGGAVEGVVAVPGLVIRQQVACMVIANDKKSSCKKYLQLSALYDYRNKAKRLVRSFNLSNLMFISRKQFCHYNVFLYSI